MPRERTTWNRAEIAKRAGLTKTADPYTMNQDHPQPAADAYVTGGPSDFAEDIHPSSGTWEAEYSGGQVKRNEIGMPEFRGDTFNHKEKTAAQIRAERIQKSALCIQVAKAMLPKTASTTEVENQALDLMDMDDVALANTYTRLAQDDQDQQQQQNPFPPEQKQAQDDQGQQQQAAPAPEQKQAQQDMLAQMQQQIAQLQQQLAQFQQQGQQQEPPVQAQGQQQVPPPVQAQGQQQVPPVQAQGQQAPSQVPVQADDSALVDQMLAQDPGQDPVADMDIELGGPSMDMGDMGGDDAVLQQLFANDETEQAQQAQQLQQKQAHAIRTASTRTVGTRPKGGVTNLGGTPSASGGRDDVASLSSMWNTAPDVREAFGLPTR